MTLDLLTLLMTLALVLLVWKMALFGFSQNGLERTLTANYGVKQSQFTKPTSEPRASDPEESNETFDRAFRGWYCSITVANYRLITVITFVVKSYTHP